MLRLVAAPSFVFLLLAGCSEPAATAETRPGVITDPLDLAYLSNRTTSGHVHDYWNGRTQVIVLEQTGPDSCITYSGEESPHVRFRPEDGDIVPQGTGELEFVLDWVEAENTGGLPDVPGVQGSEYTSIELNVKTAQDANPNPIDLPGTIEKGVPFRLMTTNAQDDPPHYVLSLWEFQPVAVNEGGDQTTFCGHFTLRVTAFRTLELIVFPPHPDPWLGEQSLSLVSFGQDVPIHVGAGVTQTSVQGYADMVLRPEAGAVVPSNATEVEVILETTPLSGPTRLGLQFHGANTRTFQTAEPTETGTRQVFRISIDAGLGDSPYASQSLWEFRVHPDNPEDVGPWTGSWTFSARAVR